MKIAIVGWGYVPEPPLSNSIYTLMSEYKICLEKVGHTVDLVDEKDPDLTIKYLNEGKYDFVHLHAFNFVESFNQKLQQKYCFTCHYGYLLKEDRWEEEFKQVFPSYMSLPGIITPSRQAEEFFIKKGYSGYIRVQPNGIDTQKINFKEKGNNKAVCLGWIQPRKQQRLLAEIIDGKIDLDFVGPLDDPDFTEGTTTKYLGIWSLAQVYANLTDYSCLVLISDGEVAPLVVLEAMAAGLCVVVSESASANLDCKDFIRVLPDNILTNATDENQQIVCDTIGELIEKNQYYRHEIVEYAKDNFDFSQTIKNYVQIIEEFTIFCKEETVEFIDRELLADGDYVSPGFEIIKPDKCFPNMIVADTNASDWPYLRREIPHNWYVDKRETYVGFLSRDEAHIIYNTALKFRGKKALEIGCWYGWSACHLALAGVELDVIDPLLAKEDICESVTNSLKSAGVLDSVNLVSGYSPQKVEELAEQLQRKWSLLFIDGCHEAPCPLNDAIICEKFAEADALVLFHDLNSPDVAQGLDYFKQKGWNTMVYQTMQIMGVAWRGNIEPVPHQPDPKINWHLPEHLQNYSVSDLSADTANEFLEIVAAIRPYTLLGEARLFSLYSLAKQVCLEDIPGNFVECGSCKGGSAALLASVIKRYSLRPRILYACDTFEGMPEPSEVDIYNGIPANLTGFGVGTLKAPIAENIESVCQLLNVKDIVVPVKGLFAQTLPQYKSEIGSIALLHADGDWYESTMDIFNTLYDSVVPNGIIQVDDYGHWDGCKKALHDFERLRGENFNLHRIDYTGVWFKFYS